MTIEIAGLTASPVAAMMRVAPSGCRDSASVRAGARGAPTPGPGVWTGLLSVVLFPLLALTLLRRDPSYAPAT